MPATSAFLKGRLIFLRSVERKDFPLIKKWLNDSEVTHFMFYGQLPTNDQQVEDFMMAQLKSPQNIVFMVCDRKGKPIGFAGLYGIHLTARKAEFRILIGEKKVWGKGYGTEITELLTFYGFDRLNLHRVYLGIASTVNKGAIRAYEKAGYKYEGTLRDDMYRNSRYHDSIIMSILRDEYYKKFYKRHVSVFCPHDGKKRKIKTRQK